ncbi:hypothetical protein L1987_83299 [Smallanthus sonchifolius]|uniref:Uncharacterized protein n=1 Tax=Smallanthus sonchifolius TaxID=185202 RepID=A0ACB8YBS4_9ASTR|nr:hypothetical protein L1987_83299 [Smallanthus sonchifolius]
MSEPEKDDRQHQYPHHPDQQPPPPPVCSFPPPSVCSFLSIIALPISSHCRSVDFSRSALKGLYRRWGLEEWIFDFDFGWNNETFRDE